MTTEVRYNDQRFEQLAEKISRIQNFELKNPDTYTLLEGKIISLEVEYRRNLKEYEFKYTHLEDDIKMIFKMINFNKDLREELRSKYENELRNFEIQMKLLISKEREQITASTEVMFKSLEAEFEKIKSLLGKTREEFNNSVGNLKQFINVEIPKFHNELKEMKADAGEKIQELSGNLNEEVNYLNSLVCYL
jgi:hypothetical protein